MTDIEALLHGTNMGKKKQKNKTCLGRCQKLTNRKIIKNIFFQSL